jgi:lysophospholipase L1-like esterase
VPFPWKAVATGAAVLGGIGALIRASRKDAPAPPKRVALIGDSYAVGLGPELAKIFPDFKYEGHVGNTSSAWASHAASCGSCGDWLTAFKPDLVLVSLGVNDGATPNPTSYQTLVRALHGIGARVVWIEPPDGVHNADATRRIVDSLGIQEVHTKVPLASDGLHPTSAGYAQWAREIAAAVSA